jgi:hypothetical protein
MVGSLQFTVAGLPVRQFTWGTVRRRGPVRFTAVSKFMLLLADNKDTTKKVPCGDFLKYRYGNRVCGLVFQRSLYLVGRNDDLLKSVSACFW